MDSAPHLADRGGLTRARDWEVTRCRQCGRTLCKNTRHALKPGEMVEIKCGTCNTMNYLMGLHIDDAA